MARYQESYGPDDYRPPGCDDSWGDVTRIDPYDDPDYGPHWNDVARCWECTCWTWVNKGSCYHTYRFRPETTVVLNDEEYLLCLRRWVFSIT